MLQRSDLASLGAVDAPAPLPARRRLSAADELPVAPFLQLVKGQGIFVVVGRLYACQAGAVGAIDLLLVQDCVLVAGAIHHGSLMRLGRAAFFRRIDRPIASDRRLHLEGGSVCDVGGEDACQTLALREFINLSYSTKGNHDRPAPRPAPVNAKKIH